MANADHLAILQQGVAEWNAWRGANPGVVPDLRNANLRDMDLHDVNFEEADLRGVNLGGANLSGANLRRADLSTSLPISGGRILVRRANLTGTDLSNANLDTANLRAAILTNAMLDGADMERANLLAACLRGAHLEDANLMYALLTRTDFRDATLDNCRIHGVAAWDLQLEGASQRSLVITRRGESTITVDDLEVAQFIYLLVNNTKIRNVINAITSKVVLILGRFTSAQKAILDQVKVALHERDYIPVIFDFDPAESRDLTETVMLLANMARFIIADLTDARSIPQELSHVIPHLPSVPVQPLLLESQREYGMFEHWRSYGWVLPEFHYTDAADLIARLDDAVINPALEWRNPKHENAHLRAALQAKDDEIAMLKARLS